MRVAVFLSTHKRSTVRAFRVVPVPGTVHVPVLYSRTVLVLYQVHVPVLVLYERFGPALAKILGLYQVPVLRTTVPVTGRVVEATTP